MKSYQKLIIILLITIILPLQTVYADSLNIYLKDAGKAMARDDLPRALQSYHDVLRLDSLNVEALKNLGVLYSLKKDHKKSLDYLLKANDLDSTDGNIYNSLGVTYSNLGDTSAALQNYKRALDIDPEDMEFARNLATLLMNRNELNKAQSLILATLAYDSTDAEAYYILGKIASGKKDYSAAEEYIGKSVSLKPWELKYLFLQAFVKEKQDNIDDATSIYKRIITLQPVHFDARKRLGALYIFMKKYPEALLQFEEAVKLRPNDLNVLLLLGAAYYFNAKPDESREIYEMLKEKDPDRAEKMIELIKAEVDERNALMDSTDSGR